MTVERLRDLYEPYLSEHDAAVAALKALKVREPALSLLLPLVIRDVEWQRRMDVRAVEAAHPRGKRDSAEAASSPMLRAALLLRVFAVGDGRLVRWGEATVDDHQLRIDFLTRQIIGTQETIGRHADSIVLITSHDVKCLDEVASLSEGEAA